MGEGARAAEGNHPHCGQGGRAVSASGWRGWLPAPHSSLLGSMLRNEGERRGLLALGWAGMVGPWGGQAGKRPGGEERREGDSVVCFGERQARRWWPP